MKWDISHTLGHTRVTQSLKQVIGLQVGNINKPTGYNATSSGLQDIPKNLVYSGQASSTNPHMLLEEAGTDSRMYLLLSSCVNLEQAWHSLE